MGDRGDRLLLRAGVVVPAEAAHEPGVPGLQPAPYPDRGPGGLDQHRLDVGAGVAGPAVLALAGADVDARAQADPGGEFLVVREVSVRRGADLAQPRPGLDVAEPWHGREQARLARPPPAAAPPAGWDRRAARQTPGQ